MASLSDAQRDDTEAPCAVVDTALAAWLAPGTDQAVTTQALVTALRTCTTSTSNTDAVDITRIG